MKKISKVLAVTLCLSFFAFMAMGSGSSSPENTKEISNVNSGSTSTDKSETEDAITENTVAEDTTTEITIEEQILYDDNNIKITATGIEDGWHGTNLNLLIENNSNQSITVQARNANVNGYMVSTMMSADVAAGKKANDSLTFETSGLKECGIDSIATMEFLFHIFESESWEEIVDTDVITVETSIADSYTQEYDDSGEILVDTDGIRIIGKGLSTNDSFWGPGVILYIENNTDRNVTVQVRDVSINGFMVDSSMSEDVVAGKKAMGAVQFFSTDLEENSIEDISDVELYFHIFDLESWDTIFDSDVISITF